MRKKCRAQAIVRKRRTIRDHSKHIQVDKEEAVQIIIEHCLFYPEQKMIQAAGLAKAFQAKSTAITRGSEIAVGKSYRYMKGAPNSGRLAKDFQVKSTV